MRPPRTRRLRPDRPDHPTEPPAAAVPVAAPAEGGPLDKPDHFAWAVALAVGLVLGAAVYFGPAGPTRDAARGVAPTPALPIVAVPFDGTRRDTLCPTPEQRTAADALVRHSGEAPGPAADDGAEPPLEPDPAGLVARLEAMAEQLGPPQEGAGLCVPVELVRRDLATLIDDLKAGRVARP